MRNGMDSVSRVQTKYADETTLTMEEVLQLPKCRTSKGRCCPVIAFRQKWSAGGRLLVREASDRCVCGTLIHWKNPFEGNDARYLEEGPNTFTTERIRSTILSNIYTVSEEEPYWPDVCCVHEEHFRQMPRFYERQDVTPQVTTRQRNMETLSLCSTLLSIIQDVDHHIERLDVAFSSMLEINFVNPRDCVEDMVGRARNLLARMQPEALQYDEPGINVLCSDLAAEYFINDRTIQDGRCLKVTSYICLAILKFAVLANIELNWPGEPPFKWSCIATQTFVNLVTELLEAALLQRPTASASASHLLVLRCFLWNCWCRCMSIQRWYVLSVQLRAGHASSSVDSTLQIAGYKGVQSVLQRISVSADSPTSKGFPEYMCPWAFELMRANSASFAADFRVMISRYRAHFGHLSARCILRDRTKLAQCDGRSPGHCMRFFGADVKNQSAHSSSCDSTCERLFWDEQSFRKVSGARAVSLGPVTDRRMNYVRATDLTMAITHVWSHGQGGRPEDDQSSSGFNSCLHERYSRIALLHGCDSYWMDTPCIPQDHQLRREAIECINEIFYQSQVTLVCDKDLMTIDIGGGELQTEIAETIIAALLVCDWNVRAWTLLEAVRGSRTLHILCKADKTVSLLQVINIVHTRGSVDLANLFLTAFHLLPLFRRTGFNPPPDRPVPWGPNPEIATHGVARTGNMLSHRHASREGDEIVIWSLLNTMPICYTAEQFWRNVLMFRTSYIVSTIPRVRGVRGLGWAPSRPDFRVGQDNLLPGRQYGEEGKEDDWAQVQKGGLLATWLVCDLRDLDFRRSLLTFLRRAYGWTYVRYIWTSGLLPSFPTGATVHKFRDKEKLANYYWNMCWLSHATREKLDNIDLEMADDRDKIVLVMRPAPRTTYNDDAVENRNDLDGTLLVVVSSSDDIVYTWRSVIRWEHDVLLPPFHRKRISIE